MNFMLCPFKNEVLVGIVTTTDLIRYL
jgi:hypothetical protein